MQKKHLKKTLNFHDKHMQQNRNEGNFLNLIKGSYKNL